MAFLTWDDRYSVGAAMDAEHKNFFNLINCLHDAMAKGKGKDVQASILKQLVAYTRTHFLHEEQLLEMRGYPDLSSHRALHNAFTKKVLDLESKMQRGLPVLTVELMDYLKDWLQNHILTHDTRYCTWMRANS